MKKGWITLLSVALVLALSTPGWPVVNTGVKGLTITGYLRNQSDIRLAAPNDIMRCDFNAAIRTEYNPNPYFQFFLELRPFVDTSYDMDDGGLSRKNRGVMGIENGDYSWTAGPPPNRVGTSGAITEVGGYVSQRDVLSTNMNTDYWMQKSFLREAWGRYRACGWDLKLGKQIVTWGETDGLKLLDFINPTDYRHFIIDDMEDSKIPTWMMNITYSFSNESNFQFLWIPWYVQNFQAPAGSAWAFNGVNLIYMYDHFDALNLRNGMGLPPGTPQFVRDNIAREACTVKYNNPHNQNEFAVRYKGTIGTATDYTINYFYTHDKNNVFIEPQFRSNPWLQGGGNDVFQFVTNPRIQRIYGGSFNHVFNKFLGIWQDLVMRGEMAYYYRTAFFGTYSPFGYFTPVLTTNPGGDIGPSAFGLYPGGDLFITYRNLLRSCVGLDKNVYWAGLNWLVSGQLFWEHIIGYPHANDNYISNVGLSKAYQDEFTWTFYVNTDIMNERIKFDNLWVWNMTKHDGWNRFKVGFDLSDSWSFWVGNNFFWGSNSSPEVNPFVGTTTVRPGAPFSPLNPDANSYAHIKRGDAIGEFKRNTSMFMELKYLF